MLPSSLLVVRRYRDTIRPGYARFNDESLSFSRRLLELFESHLGRRRRELEEAVRELEVESGRYYQYVRGLSILLERRCRFDAEAAITPSEARDRLFHAAAEIGVPTTLDERSSILEGEAAELGASIWELEDSLYADLEEEQFLKEFEPVEAEDLVRLYNLGLTQTLLFRCTEMEFNASGNWQQIFRWIKLLGLIYTIQRHEEGYRVKVDGPVSLFKLVTRYGTSLAKLLPHIVAAPEWGIQAWILRRRGDHQLLKLELDSLRHARYLGAPFLPVKEVYDSMVEESFAQRFNAVRMGWKLTREPDALPVGRHVMIPDFLFEKAGMKVYMEVAGFWTPEYLKHKLDQLQGLEGVDMIVAADRSHACQKLDNLGRRMNIIYYKGKIPLKPILKHLKAREESLKTLQLDQLKEMELRIDGHVVSSAKIAKQLGLMEEAVVETLRQRDISGYRLFGDVLIDDSTLEEIKSRLEMRMEEGPLSLRETTELIEELGGVRPYRILEHLGYTVEWRGISPEMALVHRKSE